MVETFENEIASLFDPQRPFLSFSKETRESMPRYGSALYAVFLDKTEFIYIGISGVSSRELKKRNPRKRIQQHEEGRRSGDQFCIYIQDMYVLPTLLKTNYEYRKGRIDALVRQFVRERLTFRYIVFQRDDGKKIVERLEKDIQTGKYHPYIPKINAEIG